MTSVAGFDIGGAHLKVARLEDGELSAVRAVAMPLWRGLDQLDRALDETRSIWSGADSNAVTMTAELTEIFQSRETGVLELIGRVERTISPDARFFRGLEGFAAASSARSNPSSVASANFLATARIIAALRPNSLLIDIGSTTTDIINCDRPQGLTDAERLQTGELVYTGYTRTPVPSVTTRAPLLGEWQTLARDTFATMADVRRVLGEIGEDEDLHDTADGRGKSIAESLTRLSRGFGRDGDMRHLKGWQSAAAYIREEQLRSIHDGAIQLLTRPAAATTGVITAGIGATAGATIATRLGMPSQTFGDVISAPTALQRAATEHAAAVAVALLAAQEKTAATR